MRNRTGLLRVTEDTLPTAQSPEWPRPATLYFAGIGRVLRVMERFERRHYLLAPLKAVDERVVEDRLENRRPAGGSRVALKIDIAVIGAGQGGLSSAYHLKRRGLASSSPRLLIDIRYLDELA